MIVVTGNGDLPLATQRRVERRASLLIDRPSPSLDRIYQLGLWLAIFFAIFLRLPPNKFLRIPPDLSAVWIRFAFLFLLLRAPSWPVLASLWPPAIRPYSTSSIRPLRAATCAYCSATLLKISTPVLNHSSFGAGICTPSSR